MIRSTDPLALSADSDAAGAIAILSARLMTGDSATAVLEAWCEERRLAPEPRLVARRVEGPPRALTAVQGERLRLAAGEAVRYRRVRLVCGAHVLSEAENWYVPARLTPAMNALLDTTDDPFGRVVHSLAPTRRNLLLQRVWESGALPDPGDEVFAIKAILTGRDGRPICEVSETYTGAILARGV